jgi:catechol 2,3-dioxygenase-like lactoylglutathione lyase family enzyme
MEGFVAQKLNEFETGKISRRRLIETLTLAATTAYAADGAKAQADPTLKAQLLNHISYTCSNYRQAADWYTKVLNLDQIGSNGHDVAMPFGKKDDAPYGVTAKDVPLTHLIVRTPDRDAAPPPGTQPRARPPQQAAIQTISFTVADFNRERARADLTALGVKNVRDAGPRSLQMEDAMGYPVQICGLENSALNDR